MKHNLREIQAYSSNQSDELDYREKYWFHHWLTKNKALIENKKGVLIEAHRKEFHFKTDADV